MMNEIQTWYKNFTKNMSKRQTIFKSTIQISTKFCRYSNEVRKNTLKIWKWFNKGNIVEDTKVSLCADMIPLTYENASS